jgi:hypothetical protein
VALARPLDDERVDSLIVVATAVRPSPDRDPLRSARHEREDRFRHELIVRDDIGEAQHAGCPHREQVLGAGTCAY